MYFDIIPSQIHVPVKITKPEELADVCNCWIVELKIGLGERLNETIHVLFHHTVWGAGTNTPKKEKLFHLDYFP